MISISLLPLTPPKPLSSLVYGKRQKNWSISFRLLSLHTCIYAQDFMAAWDLWTYGCFVVWLFGSSFTTLDIRRLYFFMSCCIDVIVAWWCPVVVVQCENLKLRVARSSSSPLPLHPLPTSLLFFFFCVRAIFATERNKSTCRLTQTAVPWGLERAKRLIRILMVSSSRLRVGRAHEANSHQMPL